MKDTNCDYEIMCNYKDVIVWLKRHCSFKICSFDIEASSSHGDFPTPIKNYKKVAYDIIYARKKILWKKSTLLKCF